jgi:hypothetical protein
MQQTGAIARQEDAGFRYAPANDELRSLIDELAAVYAQDLVGVTDLIHTRLDKRAQQFANAFRWKKDGN